jgi:hypothetical protein
MRAVQQTMKKKRSKKGKKPPVLREERNRRRPDAPPHRPIMTRFSVDTSKTEPRTQNPEPRTQNPKPTDHPETLTAFVEVLTSRKNVSGAEDTGRRDERWRRVRTGNKKRGNQVSSPKRIRQGGILSTPAHTLETKFICLHKSGFLVSAGNLVTDLTNPVDQG